MKLSISLAAALLCAAIPALAQAPSTGAPAHQPGVATPQHAAPAPATVSPAAPPSLADKVDPAKEAAIRHLMDVTETAKLGDNINQFLTDRVRNIMSRSISADKLPKFMDAFSQKFSAASPSSAVTDAMIPIYSRSFSMEEIQEITKFYESPVGQKIVKQMPQVTKESQDEGVRIEQNAAMSVLEGMQDDYPELKPMLHPQESAPGGAVPGGAPAPGPESGAPPQK